MKAFVEWLYKPPLIVPDAVGLLRVGPHAEKYEDPYELAVVFPVFGEIAIIKGLVSNGAIRPSHRKAGEQTLKSHGLKPDWEHFRRSSAGVTAIEYALIASLIAVVILFIVGVVGENLTATYNSAATQMMLK